MFTASQLPIWPNSSLMFSVVLFGAFVDYLNFEMLLMRVVSSAYKTNLKVSVALGMTFIWIMNNSGPRIEHCGTPGLILQ